MKRTPGSGAPVRATAHALAALALAMLAVGALAGCGSAPSPGSASAHAAAKQPPAHRPLARKPGQRPLSDADMVAAVGSEKAGVPVEVRFALRQRPEVGKPVELDVEVTPSAPVGKLVTSFHAEDGLTIQAGDAARESDRPVPGVALSRALTVVAQRDGIFYVNATVLVDNGADSVARTFTIPIIAGAGAS